MAIKTAEQLRSSLSAILGDTPTDDGLALLEDLTDTMADLTSNGSAADWKAKYENNDAAWRKRYVERFNAPVDGDGGAKDAPDNDTVPTFESLFKEV